MSIDNPPLRGCGSGADPPRIRRLEDSVVNRMVPGEVINEPSSVVKELVENSLDAGASTISVTVKDGGLKIIQVSDDGHGIRFEDLPILCGRYTTSKLSAYEDLHNIKSMGFRGEALASMTYVGDVTVVTITEGQLQGYKVSYRDGAMVHDPKPCTAVKGTEVMVENLFSNMVAQRKTLQNSNDNYLKIVDLISRFAVHHVNVNFYCMKHGAYRADIHSANSSSRLDIIRNLYGASVVHNLMKIEVSDENASGAIFKMDGYISNANYVASNTMMILFINDRLVNCPALRKAIESIYTAILAQASKPFIYISVTLPPEHVNVNINPTKEEVSLLNQDSIVETIIETIKAKMMNSNTTRTIKTQETSSLALTQPNTQRENDSDVTTASVQSKREKKRKIPKDFDIPFKVLRGLVNPAAKVPSLKLVKPNLVGCASKGEVVISDYPCVSSKREKVGNDYAFHIMHNLNHKNILSMKALDWNKMEINDPDSLLAFVEPYTGLVYSLCDAGACADKLKHIPSQLFQNIVREIVNGLDFLREMGLCHGNLSWKTTLYKHPCTVKLADFKEQGSMLLEEAQWNDYLCLVAMLKEVSIRAAEINQCHPQDIRRQYSCANIDSLIDMLEALDAKSLPGIKQSILSNPFFWGPRQRADFFVNTISLKLNDAKFLKTIDGSAIRNVPWDRNCTNEFRTLLDNMNDHRDQRINSLPCYDCNKLSAYVMCVCGAYTHRNEITLNIDEIIRKNDPTLCINLKSLVETCNLVSSHVPEGCRLN